MEASTGTVPVPDVYSEEEKEMVTKPTWIDAFMERCAQYAPGTENERVGDLRVVSPEAIAALKMEHKAAAEAKGMKFLSTNDFIMAGLCELAMDGTIGFMVANMRDRAPGITSDLAGNYERGVHFPTAVGAANPFFFRTLGVKWVYYGIEGNPHLASEGTKENWDAAKLFPVSNWASLTYFIEPPGTSVVGHCPTYSFVTDFAGFDIAIIFKMDSTGTLGVLANNFAGKRGEEIKESIAKSKIFKRLFVPAETNHAARMRSNSEQSNSPVHSTSSRKPSASCM